VESKLEAELEKGLEACIMEVNAFIKPLERATAAAVERLKYAEGRRANLADVLEQLKQRAADIE
jgi:hypothetical protein